MKTNILLVPMILSLAHPSSAQQAPPASPMRITLVAGPSPSKGARVEVIRRAQRQPANVVIVDKNATAEDLAAALAMMNALRQQYGDSLASDFRARPDVVRPGRTWTNSRYHKWLIEQLVRLRRTREAELADLGVVRSVYVFLPPVKGTVSGGGFR
jgi:hypothetical protein